MKYYISCLLLFALSPLYSQQNKSLSFFQLNLNIGSRVYKPNPFFNSNYGGGFDMELQYHDAENNAIGFRIEQSFLQNEIAYRDLGTFKGMVGNNFSTYITYNKILADKANPLKPFVGLGLGLNNLNQWQSIGYENVKIFNESKVGSFIRTGLQYKFLQIGLEYNFIAKSTYQNKDISNSNFAIKLGGNIKFRKKVISNN